MYGARFFTLPVRNPVPTGADDGGAPGTASCAPHARRRVRVISCGVISTALIFLNLG